MRVAICPGSFDPVTKGHLDILHRAAKLFDKIIVVVVINPEKKVSFTAEERMDLIRRVTQGIPNIEVDMFSGLLMDYVRDKNAVAVVKGLRAVTDFEYEFQMALINKKLNPNADTLFLTTSAENLYLSSSIVKQIASFGGNIADFVPAEIVEDVKERLCPAQ